MPRLYHLNCISECPFGGRLMDGRTGATGPAVLSCHCVVVELSDRLVLVDTGFGLEDVRRPRPRLSPLFLAINRPQLDEEQTARRQIERLGFRASDVSDIVLTHLDFDHAGGLDDFPHARVHMLEAERVQATRRRTFLERQRFRPQQWGTTELWRTYPADGVPWFGLTARELDGLPPEILLVPLAGHTMGHAGVALARGDGRWLLHCGDAYFHHDEMDPGRPRGPVGARLYQWVMDSHHHLREINQRFLRGLVRRWSHEVELFSSHDVVEFEALAGGAPVEVATRYAASGWQSIPSTW